MAQQPSIPVAQYVRMSADHQQYSIENQKTAIEQYAIQNGFHIARTFADPGKSGLVISRRTGIRSLLEEVISGKANFEAILVYDVTRWGRFQDPDEAAHYEFLCKQVGIPVHYCAEQFTNDGTVPSSILKAIKGTMAAEFSRELSVKVYEGQRRLSGLGFKMGGVPGYGLRRLMVSADGKRRRKLKPGEWKSITTDRILLVPGTKDEVKCIRKIFSMYVTDRMVPRQISDALNAEGLKFVLNRRWNTLAVYRILRNPEYAGYCTWGRTSQRLRTKSIHLPRSDWKMKPGCFEPIIDESTFAKTQKILIAHNSRARRSDEELILKLKRVLTRHGKLSEKIISASRGAYHKRTYWKRFGSLLKAYELAGFKFPPQMARTVEHSKNLRLLQVQVSRALCELFPEHVRLIHEHWLTNRIFEVDGTHKVSFFVCREFRTLGGEPRWMFRNRPNESNNILLVCRTDREYKQLLSYHVLPPVGNSIRVYKQIQERHPWLATGKELNDLSEFYNAVRDIAQRGAAPGRLRKK